MPLTVSIPILLCIVIRLYSAHCVFHIAILKLARHNCNIISVLMLFKLLLMLYTVMRA